MFEVWFWQTRDWTNPLALAMSRERKMIFVLLVQTYRNDWGKGSFRQWTPDVSPVWFCGNDIQNAQISLVQQEIGWKIYKWIIGLNYWLATAPITDEPLLLINVGSCPESNQSKIMRSHLWTQLSNLAREKNIYLQKRHKRLKRLRVKHKSIEGTWGFLV